MKIVCEQCGKNLQEDNLFCPSCGVDAPRGTQRGTYRPESIAVPQYCPLCKHACLVGSRFCTACGHNHFQKPDEGQTVHCPGCGSGNSNKAQICYNCSLSLSDWFAQKGEAARRLGLSLPFSLRETMNGFVYYFTQAGKITIGRYRDNDICIPCSFISGHHLEIDLETNSFRDHSSTNGTFINRKPDKINKIALDLVSEFNLAGYFTLTLVRNQSLFALRLTRILDEEDCRRNGDGSVFDVLCKSYFVVVRGNGKIVIGKTNGTLDIEPRVGEIYWEIGYDQNYLYLSDLAQGINRKLIQKEGVGLAPNWRIE